MIEAEELRAHLEEIEKKEALEKADQEAVSKAEEKEKRENFIKQLPEEPKSGNLINVAFRLPNGKRLMRNFRQEDPIKVEINNIVHAGIHLL